MLVAYHEVFVTRGSLKQFTGRLRPMAKLLRGHESSIYMSASYEELVKSWKKLEKVMHLSKKW